MRDVTGVALAVLGVVMLIGRNSIVRWIPTKWSESARQRRARRSPRQERFGDVLENTVFVVCAVGFIAGGVWTVVGPD
jgi:hypothetical protein